MEDFETKLAAAGEILEKLAAERGMSVGDFTDEETMDLLSTIMGDGGTGGGDAPVADPKTASETPSTPAAPAAPAASVPTTKVAYTEALAEVMKIAQANNFDLNKVSAEELHKNVEQMQAIMSDPQYQEKQAAFKEKVAEADALGRVMAHAYVDELGKIASTKTASPAATPTPTTEPTLAEKKAAFVRELRERSKQAGEMPPQFAAHAKGKKDGEKDDKDGDKDEAEKKAAFEKAAALRASEVLIAEGINPATGSKFASEQERVDAGAALILQQKGYRFAA